MANGIRGRRFWFVIIAETLWEILVLNLWLFSIFSSIDALSNSTDAVGIVVVQKNYGGGRMMWETRSPWVGAWSIHCSMREPKILAGV